MKFTTVSMPPGNHLESIDFLLTTALAQLFTDTGDGDREDCEGARRASSTPDAGVNAVDGAHSRAVVTKVRRIWWWGVTVFVGTS